VSIALEGGGVSNKTLLLEEGELGKREGISFLYEVDHHFSLIYQSTSLERQSYSYNYLDERFYRVCI